MSKYFSLKGCATRSEYWGVLLISTVAVFALAIVGVMLFALDSVPATVVGACILIGACFAGAWVQLTVVVRRCRDIGINPWFVLAIYIPYIGLIPCIVFGCLASEKKEDGLA